MGQTFGSDNQAGTSPAILEVLSRSAAEHLPAYGADPITTRAKELFRSEFGDCEVAFLATGTAANVLAVELACRSFESVVASEHAHLRVDECGAIERRAGVPVVAVPSADGKLTPDALERVLPGRGDVHRSQPRLVSISQTTEYGTVYTPAEIRALADGAHARGLLLHVDGARLANAAAALGCGLGALTRDVGVDLVSFGGTKNGCIAAEALVVLNPALAEGIRFRHKQSTHLLSKVRFVSAQFVALLEGGLWQRHAAHANAMANRLVEKLDGAVPLTQRVEANAVFARVPDRVVENLGQRRGFGWWAPGEVRWMCAFDTRADEVDAFAEEVRRELAA